MADDGVQVGKQRQCEGPRAIEPHEAGEPFHAGGVGREGVGLAVSHHLQPVLDGAQEAVGGQQVVGGGTREVAGGDQRLECARGGGFAQRRVPAAPDELHGLGGELDSADAALPQLHIVPGEARHGVRVVGQRGGVVVVHAALHGADVGNGGEIEVAAPDEGADLAQEPLPQRAVAGDGAGLDHGGAFPVLTHAFVVGERRRQADGGRGGRRVGPEAQIRAEHVAVRIPRLHKGTNIPRYSCEHLAEPCCVSGMPIGVVDQDEVDIAGIIQLARAQLAHAEHHQAALGQQAAPARHMQRAACRRSTQGEAEARVQRGLGEGGERLGNLLQRPHAADIGQRRRQGDPALGLAQGRRHGRPVCGGGQPCHALQRGSDDRLRTVAPDQAQDGGLPDGEVSQVRAVAAECREHRGEPWLGQQTRLARAQVSEPFQQPVRRAGVRGRRPACGLQHGHAAASATARCRVNTW